MDPALNVLNRFSKLLQIPNPGSQPIAIPLASRADPVGLAAINHLGLSADKAKAARLAGDSRAAGTLTAHNRAIKTFLQFCEENKKNSKTMSKATIISFLQYLELEKKVYSFINTVSVFSKF